MKSFTQQSTVCAHDPRSLSKPPLISNPKILEGNTKELSSLAQFSFPSVSILQAHLPIVHCTET